MSEVSETEEFLYSLRTGRFRLTGPMYSVECSRCEGRGQERKREKCRRCLGHKVIDEAPAMKGHPADAWTIRELRKLSINGSFR